MARPFRCTCSLPLERHTFSGAQQMRTVHGKPRLHAHVRCPHPPREWWSRHKDALAASRDADQRARG